MAKAKYELGKVLVQSLGQARHLVQHISEKHAAKLAESLLMEPKDPTLIMALSQEKGTDAPVLHIPCPPSLGHGRERGRDGAKPFTRHPDHLEALRCVCDCHVAN